MRSLPLDALDLDQLLQRAGLTRARERWAALARIAEREGWSHADYLAAILAEELRVAERKAA